MAMATDREPVMEMWTVTSHLLLFLLLESHTHSSEFSHLVFIVTKERDPCVCVCVCVCRYVGYPSSLLDTCGRCVSYVCVCVCVFWNDPIWASLGTSLPVSLACSMFRNIWHAHSHSNPHVSVSLFQYIFCVSLDYVEFLDHIMCLRRDEVSHP